VHFLRPLTVFYSESFSDLLTTYNSTVPGIKLSLRSMPNFGLFSVVIVWQSAMAMIVLVYCALAKVTEFGAGTFHHQPPQPRPLTPESKNPFVRFPALALSAGTAGSGSNWLVK